MFLCVKLLFFNLYAAGYLNYISMCVNRKARFIKETGFVDLKTLGQFANHFILAFPVP